MVLEIIYLHRPVGRGKILGVLMAFAVSYSYNLEILGVLNATFSLFEEILGVPQLLRPCYIVNIGHESHFKFCFNLKGKSEKPKKKFVCNTIF